MERLRQFLSGDPIVSEGGWPPITDEDFEELRGLVLDLIDLKIGRDPDGDRVIEVAMVNRRHGYLASVIVPYAPDVRAKEGEEVTHEQMIDYVDRAMGTQDILQGFAESVGRSARGALYRVRSELAAQREHDVAVSELRGKIPNGDFEEMGRRVYEFSKTYRGSPVTSELIDLWRASNRSVFESAEQEAIDALNRAGEDPEKLAAVRKMIEKGLRDYGPFGFSLVTSHYNEDVRKRRKAIRAAGGKPTEDEISIYRNTKDFYA